MTTYARENKEQEKFSSIAGGSTNFYRNFGKQNDDFLGTWESIYLKTNYTTLGIYPKDT